MYIAAICILLKTFKKETLCDVYIISRHEINLSLYWTALA